MRVRGKAAGLIAIGIIVAIVATFVTNLPIASPATDDNGLFLVKPAFAQTNTTSPVATIAIATDSSWKSMDAEAKGWTSAPFDDSWWLDSWESDPPASLGQARAIWYPEKPVPFTAYFRKSIDTSGGEVISGRIHIVLYARDVEYGMPEVGKVFIYINDQYVGKMDSGGYSNNWWREKDFDILSYLTPGKNVIAVKVEFDAKWVTKPPGPDCERNWWGLNGTIRYTTAPPNEPPLANAGFDKTATARAVVTLDGSGSRDPDGSIVSYEWDFGDGTKGAGKTASHIYSEPGVYTLRLTVTDNSGAQATDEVTVHVVKENHPPVINSVSAEQMQVTPGTSIRITASTTDADGDSINYNWSCDEGIINGAGPTTTWVAPERNGTYQVTLEVSDGHGGIQKDSISIRVSSEMVVTPSSPQQPYVDLYGHKTDVIVGEEVILYLSAVNPITSPGTLIVQLTLRIPSGWSITSSGFGHGAGGLRTNTYEIEQGPSQRVIDVNILANEPFEGIVEGKIDYYFAEYEETKYHNEVTLPVTASMAGASPESAVQPSTTSPDSSENKGISGALIAVIIGICTATVGGVFARLVWRRVHQPVAERGGVSEEFPLPRADERPKRYGETNQKGINQDIYKLITDHLGSKVVDNLSSDVLDQLVQAEKNYQNKEQPRRAITDLYEAVAICLQQYFVGKVLSKLNTLKSYTEQPNLSFSSLAVYQCSDIFSNIDDPNPNKIRDPFIKTRWSLIRDATIQAFPKFNRRRLTILANNLREIQKLRNPYEHLEKDALKDPKPWHEERQDLEYIRSMVLGSEQKVSAIAEIIEIFG